jgi:hypothetical protein
MMTTTFLLYYGSRYLTEVRAHNADEARRLAVKNDTVVQCSLTPGETPAEYRQRVWHSRAVPLREYEAPPLRCVDCAGPLTPRGNCSRDILHVGAPPSVR